MSTQIFSGFVPIYGKPQQIDVVYQEDGSVLIGVNSAIGSGGGGGGGGGIGDMLKSVYDTDGDNVVDLASSVPWIGITGKPSTFAPSSHTHPGNEIISKVSAAGTADVANAVAWSNITGTPSTFAPSSHTHLGTEITSKVSTAGTADVANAVAWLDITGKPSTFAPSSHTHLGSEVTSKVSTAGTADVANAVAWSNITGTPSTFAPSSHAHSSHTGLNDDDHIQYALLAGRSAGQTIVGGTGAGGSLTLQSTSNASKGDVVVSDPLLLSSVTASRIISADANKRISSVSSLTSWVAGTVNEVIVSDDGDGTITLSLPQDVHTAAVPVFAGLIAPSVIGSTSANGTLTLRGNNAFLGNTGTNAAISFGVGNSASNTAMTITNSGNVGIGTTDPEARLNVLNTVSANTVQYGGISELDFTSTANNLNESFAFGATLRFRGTLGNSSFDEKGLTGFAFAAFNSNTGTVDHMQGLYGDIRNLGTGTITNFSGIRLPGGINSGGGTITNFYGLKIEPQSVGTNRYALSLNNTAATNVYNVYAQGTAQNYFAGNVGIGTTSPSAPIDATTISTRGGTDNTTLGWVRLFRGASDAAGYVDWFRPNQTRIAYLGWNDGGVNNLGLTLENSAHFNINGGNVGIGIGTTSPSRKLHVAGTILIDGDEGGIAGTIGLTDVSDLVARSTGVGTIKFNDSINRNSSGFIKIYIGTTAYYVPVFAEI